MKIFFDTEFTGLRKETELISIGMVDEDGNSFYAEFNDYDLNKANILDKTWLLENVIAKLEFNGISKHIDTKNCKIKGDKLFIKKNLNKWLSKYNNINIKFVSDVNHYDFVLLIDLLWGHAKNIPSHISYACLDIDTIQSFFNIQDLPTTNKNYHNSLNDAEEIKEKYNLLKKKLI